jgi:hypothetical protein
MKKQFTLILSILAFLISSQAQPDMAKFHKSGDWYEPDTVYLYNTSGSAIGRHSFSYENGKCMFSIIERGIPFVNDTKYMFTYDEGSNIAETLTLKWNKEFLDWENDRIIKYIYDAHKNLLESVEQIWQGEEWGGWGDAWRNTYTYNAQNKVTEHLKQIWYTEFGEWKWVNEWKFSYTYNIQNNIDEQLIEKWSSEFGWFIDGKYIYRYDTQNNSITMQFFNCWGLDDWRLAFQLIHTYDTQNNRIEEIFQWWQNVWANDEKITYTYDENNNATACVYQRWGNNAWYDAKGWLDLNYNNMQSTWSYDELCKYTATYIKTSSNSIQENRVENEIKIYPNPSNGQLTIDNGQLTINNIEVFDVYGRKCHVSRVTCHDIDISHLPAGVYMVKIDGVCRKVVKQ